VTTCRIVCLALVGCAVFSAPSIALGQEARDTVYVDTMVVKLDPTRDSVFFDRIVEQSPQLVSSEEPLRYPDALRQAGVQGLVLVQFIIGKTGYVERGSIHILQTPDKRFDDPVHEFVLHSRFQPARVHGRPVRALVTMPVEYSIGRPPPLRPFGVGVMAEPRR